MNFKDTFRKTFKHATSLAIGGVDTAESELVNISAVNGGGLPPLPHACRKESDAEKHGKPS